MAQDLGQLTDMWMANPTMFDPTQKSNAYSLYNNAALPWPPSYNPGLAGGPVNAATGKPIQSFQQWQQQNPGGMSINSTPAQPPIDPNRGLENQWLQANGQSPLPTQQGAAAPGMTGAQSMFGTPSAMNPSGNAALGMANWGAFMSPQQQQAMSQPVAAPQAAAAPQQSGPPNNWQAAINSLANPDKVQTMGANVPIQSGTQPAGGVNQAFLQQAGQGQGMNSNFLSALRAIQGR